MNSVNKAYMGIANAFISACKDSLKLSNINLQVKDMFPRQEYSPPGPICIIIGFNGDFKGQVVFSMPDELGIALTRVYSTSMLDSAREHYKFSAVCETANIIAGNASCNLCANNDKINVDITPPAIVMGLGENKGSLILPYKKAEAIIIQLYCPDGILELGISVHVNQTENI